MGISYASVLSPLLYLFPPPLSLSLLLNVLTFSYKMQFFKEILYNSLIKANFNFNTEKFQSFVKHFISVIMLEKTLSIQIDDRKII